MYGEPSGGFKPRTEQRHLRMPGRLKRFAALLACCLPTAVLPATGPERDQIRSFLEGMDAGDAPVVAGQRLNEPGILSGLYRARDHEPIWLGDGPLEAEVPGMLAAIDQSLRHGFTAERYHYATILKLMADSAGGTAFALDLLLTDAFLGQAVHRARGVIFTPDLDPGWKLPPSEVDAGALLLDAARHRRPVGDVLEALWPTDEEYARLLRRRAEIGASGEESMTRVAPGPLLRPGQSGERVLMLKERLMGPGDHSALYDEDLRREVMAFQLSAGLEPDGIVGEHTLEVLNATRGSWIDRIDANLERWRWLPRETPNTYVRVNIAAFTLRVIESGRQTLAMNVIVGRPYRQTPVFTETIKYMVLNPFWNVPYKIATEDKLPQLKLDASAEAEKGFEAQSYNSDEFVSVAAIDWARVTPLSFSYLLRQRPGIHNALGQVKFMLPNPYSVYLHDTPARDLFARQERTFSSGCIRLEKPLELASWLLSHEERPDAGSLEATVASGETRTIYLENPMPIYIVYFTAFTLEDGEVVFRRDVYGRDRPLIEALRAGQS